MAFLMKLVAVIAFVTVSNAVTPKYSSNKNLQNRGLQQTQESYIPQVPYVDPAYDSYQIPLNLQLPKAEAPEAAFFSPEPSTNLKPPQYFKNPEPNYFQVPVPAQELRAPVETEWNPNNDPKFFYEIPAVLSKQETPTNMYPKKYNKDVHTKEKPYSFKPKQEIVLQPINQREYNFKEKNLNKVYQNLAKKDNKKAIKKVPKKLAYTSSEPQISASGFSDGFESDGGSPHHHHHSASSGGFTQGLSADLTESLGIEHSPAKGERLEFHMTGHDGPHSYKWGFDTGEGHNRQFRFEEKDKEGIVKGHFGFYDKHGKLQMINYDAHPHDGFHAESSFGKF